MSDRTDVGWVHAIAGDPKQASLDLRAFCF